MAYVLFTLSIFCLILATVLYFTRAHWLHRVPDFSFPGRDYFYDRLPTSFAGDIEAGLSSSTFDLGENVDAGDSRAGLDAQSKAEILKIMKRRRLKFDEARRVYMENRFRANGIGADGRPNDPKLVTFS